MQWLHASKLRMQYMHFQQLSKPRYLLLAGVPDNTLLKWLIVAVLRGPLAERRAIWSRNTEGLALLLWQNGKAWQGFSDLRKFGPGWIPYGSGSVCWCHVSYRRPPCIAVMSGLLSTGSHPSLWLSSVGTCLPPLQTHRWVCLQQ